MLLLTIKVCKESGLMRNLQCTVSLQNGWRDYEAQQIVFGFMECNSIQFSKSAASIMIILFKADVQNESTEHGLSKSEFWQI
jgi:hypothetical protein